MDFRTNFPTFSDIYIWGICIEKSSIWKMLTSSSQKKKVKEISAVQQSWSGAIKMVSEGSREKLFFSSSGE